MFIRIAGNLSTFNYLSFILKSRAKILYYNFASVPCVFLINLGLHKPFRKTVVLTSSNSNASHQNLIAMNDIVKLLDLNYKDVERQFVRSLNILERKIGKVESIGFHKKLLASKWFDVLFSYNVASEIHGNRASVHYELPDHFPFEPEQFRYTDSLQSIRTKLQIISRIFLIFYRHLVNIKKPSKHLLQNTVIVEKANSKSLNANSKHLHVNILKKIYPNFETLEYSYDSADKESILVINPYSISLSSLKYIFGLLLDLIKLFRSNESYVLSNFWLSYSRHISLFESLQPSIIVYLTFPNGVGGFRNDDSVVTGLARTHNIECHGIQTRFIYTNKYEDCFDVYDKYFSWSDFWFDCKTSRSMCVKEIFFVNCIYEFKNKSKELSNRNVLIFDGDINPNSHYNFDYYCDFIVALIYVASEMKNTNFLIKFKNVLDVDMSHHLIKELLGFKNVYVLANERFNYEEELVKSNLVISLGFTTPGYEAYLAGIRSIYYSSWPLNYITFFDKIKIASTPKELQMLLNDIFE